MKFNWLCQTLFVLHVLNFIRQDRKIKEQISQKEIFFPLWWWISFITFVNFTSLVLMGLCLLQYPFLLSLMLVNQFCVLITLVLKFLLNSISVCGSISYRQSLCGPEWYEVGWKSINSFSSTSQCIISGTTISHLLTFLNWELLI